MSAQGHTRLIQLAGVIRWEYPVIKFTIEGKPDGSEMEDATNSEGVGGHTEAFRKKASKIAKVVDDQKVLKWCRRRESNPRLLEFFMDASLFKLPSGAYWGRTYRVINHACPEVATY